MSARFGLVAAIMVLAGVATARAASDDEDMRELVRRAGCTLCHEVPVRPDALVQRRLAPGWRDIALRYVADPRAEDSLTRTVLAGTGPLIRDKHWRDKIFLGDMPNNDVQISAADARAVVRWILDTPR